MTTCTAQLEKFDAMIGQIDQCNANGQPVLVGTTSIEKSELLSALLKKKKIPHKVLNARYHEKEAQIIAQAGKAGGVTIATNMAGRGTDIKLGGNIDMRIEEELAGINDELARARKIKAIEEEAAAAREKVLGAGGLYVLGTERHESRRIDNQLRGRSGRQGDPGRSKFFLSLEDDLLRIFGSERMDGMLQKLGLQQGEAIIHPWINRAVAKAQEKVEARNFDIRKNLLKFDDVMNDQRKVVFEQRIDMMRTGDLSGEIAGMRQQTIDDLVALHIPEKAYAEHWDAEGLAEACRKYLGLDLPSLRGPPKKALPTRKSASASAITPTGSWPRAPLISALMSCARSKNPCCCRSSISIGVNICCILNICARRWACAAMRSAIRCANISPKPLPCLKPCWRNCARM